MSKLRQVTAWKPGKYRGIDFSLDDIKAYVEGTNKAIQAGIPVPLLKRHATIGASDSDTVAAANLDGAGWIKSLEVTNDGHIAWNAEDVPEDVKEGIEAGNLKFTSPEFRKSYSSELEGVYTGPIIRHFAFTALPGNPHQGKITDPSDPRINEQAAAMAMSEELRGISKARQAETGCFQFDEEDLAKEGQQFAAKDLTSASVPDPTASVKKKPGSDDAEDDPDHTVNKHMGEGSKDGSINLDGADMDKEEGTEEGEDGSKRKKASQPQADASAHAEKPIQKEANDNDEPPAPPELVEGTDIVAESAPPEAGTEAANPDMPPKATDKSKTAAILAGLKRKGVVLPSDWSMEKEGAADLLLTGLNTAIEAENQAEMEDDSDDEEEESPPQDSAMPYSEGAGKDKFHEVATKYGYKLNKDQSAYVHPDGHSIRSIGFGYGHSSGHTGVGHRDLKRTLQQVHGKSQHSEQFSEEELASLPPKARAAIEAGNRALAVERKAKEDAQKAQAAAFAEEQKAKNNAAKDKAKDVVSRAKIPPSLRTSLLGSFDTVQFSEGKEKPLYTASQVAEMVAKSIPPHLQFGEDDAGEATAPKASKVIGKDPITGAPLMGEATEEQFFEDDIPSGHVSASRAEELVAANPHLGGFNRNPPRPGGVPVSIPDLVRAENGRVPNNVRHGW